MQSPRWNCRLLCAAGAALALGVAARGDTIVLKNGRRIEGTNITRADGKVSCETPAGVITVSESIVAAIEKQSAAGTASINPAAANLSIGPPPDASAGTASEDVIRDGAIDLDALARIDNSAASGDPKMIEAAVAAELGASHFAYGKGDLDAALDHAERAVSFGPNRLPLLLTVAYLHLRRAEYSAAIDTLDAAKRLSPDSPDVAKLAGWAEYGLNHLGAAVSEWKQSLDLRPDPDVKQALDKAQHELEVEGDFREGDSAHFVLRYDGGSAPELARGVLQVLEGDYADISAILSDSPVEPISVVLYTNEAFRDITRAPGWVGALNDGKIRVPVQGLVAVTPELARILRHELAHSFVNEKTHGNCPVWLQEGIAQWIEGQRSGASAPTLLALYNQQADPSLTVLEGSWMKMPPEFVSTAYAWSLATIEAIEANDPGDIVRVLDRLASGESAESAIKNALQLSYADLNGQTGDYLRKTYGH